MLLPGRDTFDPQYRFGFNGKENELDFRGIGVITDYGARIYNARLGKFLSVDPLQSKFAYFTPYQYAGNRPIEAIDLDGLEPVSSNDMLIRKNAGITKWNQNVESVYEPTQKKWYSVMNYPISNDQYYWKNNNGSDGMYPGDKNAGKSGYWQRYLSFEQQFNIQVDKDMNAMGMAWAALFTAPFAAGAIAEAGGATAWSVITNEAVDAAARGILAIISMVLVLELWGRSSRRCWMKVEVSVYKTQELKYYLTRLVFWKGIHLTFFPKTISKTV